jgi:hypothetical protein
MYRDAELSLPALLDYMGCDDWLVQAFLGMESGRDCDICQYSSEQLREVEKTKNKLQQARQELGKQLMNERTAGCQIDEKPFVDMLVRCQCSGKIAWVRFNCQSGDSEVYI